MIMYWQSRLNDHEHVLLVQHCSDLENVKTKKGAKASVLQRAIENNSKASHFNALLACLVRWSVSSPETHEAQQQDIGQHRSSLAHGLNYGAYLP